MKLVKTKTEDTKIKIFFADEDDWGYVKNGLIVQTDLEYNVKALELYSAKAGIVFWDCVHHKHVFNAWENDDVIRGTFGISKAFTVKFSQRENLMGDEKYFYSILDELRKGLTDAYLVEALNAIILYKKPFSFEIDRYTQRETGNLSEEALETSGVGDKIKGLFKRAKSV